MRRRALLALAASALPAFTGCAGSTRPGDDVSSPAAGSTASTTPHRSASTDSTTSATPTSVDLPARCPFAPDVDGLPAWPDDPTAEAATAFVREYERTLALARNEEYERFNRLQHVSTERVDGAYRVYFFAEPLSSMSPRRDEPSSTETSTPHPTAAPSTYNVGYFVGEHRLVRWKRPSALTYRFSPYDGFDPREGGDLVACRTSSSPS